MRVAMRAACAGAALVSLTAAAAGDGFWFITGKLLVSVAWAVVALGWGRERPVVGAAWLFAFTYNAVRWAHTTVVTDSWWALAFLMFWALSGTVVLTIAGVSTALHRESRRLSAAAARQVWERGTYEW